MHTQLTGSEITKPVSKLRFLEFRDNMERLVCVSDFETQAGSILGKNAWEFFTSGADDELTVKGNKDAYDRLVIRPRILRDVGIRTLSKNILGKGLKVPIGVSPMAFQGLGNKEGECGTAKGK